MSGKSRPSPPTMIGSWAMAELLFEEKARARRAREEQRDEPKSDVRDPAPESAAEAQAPPDPSSTSSTGGNHHGR